MDAARETLQHAPLVSKRRGCAALGRLGFTDNYVRLITRLKREIQEACHPDAIYQTVAQTGLALRDNVPRVYVVGCATGGASGYLPDLGYALRRMIQQMHQGDSPVVSFLFCGAPEDPATPRNEQANLYATLTELNHFADPAIPFSAQYGTDGPRLVDEGRSYDQVYLLTQQHRSPEARRDALSHMGSYLFHEITTPLGLRLDNCRLKRNLQSPFRSLGTFGVWFPRGLLLRLAARNACQRLLEDWQAGAGEGLTGPEQSLLEVSYARVVADPELTPEALGTRIGELAAGHLDAQPREALTRLLLTVEEQSRQSVAQDDPGVWARQTLGRIRDWLGGGVALPGVNVIQQRRSALTRALEASATQLAQDWDARLVEVITGLMENGGRRLALAETAVARLMHFCDEASKQQKSRVQAQAARTQLAQQQLDAALEACSHGASGWSFFGGRSKRIVRAFVDDLTAFSRQCLAEDMAGVILQFFAALRGRLADRMRDLGFCRQRLRHLQEALSEESDTGAGDVDNLADSAAYARSHSSPGFAATKNWPVPAGQLSPTPLLSTEAYWETIRESTTNRVVLPDGEPDLRHAAKHFLGILSPEHWTLLDQAIGDQVLTPGGGLLKLCLDNRDLIRFFATPLLNQAIACLSDHLPITDVAQAEFSTGDGVEDRILAYHASSNPLLTRLTEARRGMPEEKAASLSARVGLGSGVRRTAVIATRDGSKGEPPINGGAKKSASNNDQLSFLLVPASDSGKDFGEEAKRLIPELHLVKVPGQSDLMFCREQAALGIEDLEKMLRQCRGAITS